MAQALGVRFYNKKHQIIDIHGGKDLLKIDFTVSTNVDKRLDKIVIDVACY